MQGACKEGVVTPCDSAGPRGQRGEDPEAPGRHRLSFPLHCRFADFFFFFF